MRNFIKTIGHALLLLLAPFNGLANTSKDGKIKKIVLDPGHGGKDPGAVGKRSMEKDIVLKIALKLGKIIEANMKDVKVLYTRKTDEFIPLYQRSQEANKNNADLFVSIHCNASTKPHDVANGVEFFTMGLEKSERNLSVAKIENAAILVEANQEEHYQGFDPRSPESHILFSLFQNAYTKNSLQLAEYIHTGFKNKVDLKIRGVKQGPFLVLWQTTCPSVLIEVGFITNPKEEKFLNTEAGQKKIALAIFEGLKQYKLALES